jgi:hypothetical protein
MTPRIIYIPLLIFFCCASGAGLAQSGAPPASAPPASATGAPAARVIPRTPSTEKAVAAATAFINGIIRDSSVDQLMSLCSLPFCHDDSIILLTHAELRSSLSQLRTAAAGDRAKNHPRVDSAYVLDIRKEALFSMVPINIYFTVVNMKFTVGGKEGSKMLILAVQLTDEARIVGIED